MLAQFFNEGIAEWTRAVMSVGLHLRRFARNFPAPMKAGQVPLAEVLRTREWLQKVEVTLIGVEENWLPGWSTGAMSLVGEVASKE